MEKQVLVLAALLVLAHGNTIIVQPTSSIANNNISAPQSVHNNGSIRITVSSSYYDTVESIKPTPATAVVFISSTSVSQVQGDTGLSFENLIMQLTEFQIGFTINETWYPNLAINTSNEYNEKKGSVISVFDEIYRDDVHYVETVLQGFFQGSVKVLVKISFKFPQDSNSTVITASTSKINANPNSIGNITIVPFSTEMAIVTDGVWGDWQDAGICDTATKTITRVRTCTGPTGGGRQCEGPSTQKVPCSTGSGVMYHISKGLLSAVMILMLHVF